jgi:EAL domain-containing protein (putative c-di-GMP-specific phosphodiesterase class I)
VAEGIETTIQRDALAGVGCSHAQGYLFARPLPPPDLLAWLAAQHAVAV